MSLEILTRDQFIDIMVNTYGWTRQIDAVYKLVKHTDSIILEKQYFTLNNFGRLHYYKYCKENVLKILELYDSASHLIEFKLKNEISMLRGNRG